MNPRPSIPYEPGTQDGTTPQERIPLWALVEQTKDIAGEIAIACDMLDSEERDEVEAAVGLLDTYVQAEHATKAVLYDKADNIASYIVALQRQSEARRAAAQEDYERSLARAERDQKRAEKLLHYLHTQLQRIEPEAKRFELPNYDLTSRAGSVRTVVDEDAELPEEFLYRPPAPKARPDLKAIKAALQSGREVPGAQLIQGERTWTLKR
jgi:hypothetical protein